MIDGTALKHKTIDYLVVGQGLAGSTLALELDARGCSFRVVDRQQDGSATRVAAGIINPVVLRRLSLTWGATRWLEASKSYYEEKGNAFGKRFFRPMPIARMFSAKEDRQFWTSKTNDPELAHFMDALINETKHAIPTQHGFGRIRHGGGLDLPALLDSVRQWLNETDRIDEEPFSYHDLSQNGDVLRWKPGQRDYAVGQVIFAEGYRMVHNPFFDYLPLRPSKGELFHIRVPGLELQEIAHRGIFLVPLGDDRYWAGATYAWNDLDPQPTEKGVSELKGKLQDLLQRPFEILEVKTGMRPTVKDRRPLLGTHPMTDRLAVFNGLGTKGTMLAPQLAQHLVAHLTDDKPLSAEVDIRRFEKYHTGDRPFE